MPLQRYIKQYNDIELTALGMGTTSYIHLLSFAYFLFCYSSSFGAHDFQFLLQIVSSG